MQITQNMKESEKEKNPFNFGLQTAGDPISSLGHTQFSTRNGRENVMHGWEDAFHSWFLVKLEWGNIIKTFAI